METLKKICVFGVKVFLTIALFAIYTTHVSAGPILDGEVIEPDPAEIAVLLLNYRSLNRNFNRNYCAKFLRAKIEGVEPPHNDKNYFCLDKYSKILSPEDVRRFMEQVKGQYFGLGIYLIESDSGEVTVAGFVSEDSPAHGIMREGDVILSVRRADDVGGEDRQFISSVEDLSAYLDKEGKAPLVATVLRDGSPVELPSITPSNIVYPNVTYSKFGTTGYIRVSTFNSKTSQLFLDALMELSAKEEPANLIIDLRGNGGGTLKSVTRMLEFFSKPDDIIIKEVWFGGITTINAGRGPLVGKYLKNNKIVVLIDNRSASASEVFAGVMKDVSNGENILIVGMTSYGKGVVQTIFKIPKGYMFRLTTAEYVVGNSMTMIHGVGVTPDYCVKDTRSSEEEGDAQLLYALMLVDTVGDLPEKYSGKKCSE